MNAAHARRHVSSLYPAVLLALIALALAMQASFVAGLVRGAGTSPAPAPALVRDGAPQPCVNG